MSRNIKQNKIVSGNKSLKTQKLIIIVTFLTVPMILMGLFSYYPAIKLFQQSFTDWDGMRPFYKYVGFKNYKAVFNDTETLKTFQNTLAYFIIMIIQTILGLYLAIILNGTVIKFKNFFKSIIFMPYILNGVAIAYMFNYMYDYNKGPLNVFLRNIGLGQYAIRWLGDGYYINFSLAFIGMWQFTGFAMVIFLGALQSISQELYEAANLDGANFFQTTKYITMPSIKRVIELNLFLGIVGSLQAFSQAFLITKGGPAGRSDTFITKTLSTAFDFRNFGKASAMGVVLLIVVLVLVSIQRSVLKEEE